MAPDSTEKLFAFEGRKLFKSRDGGTTFIQVKNGSGSPLILPSSINNDYDLEWTDLIFVPSQNGEVMYASTNDKLGQNGGALVFKSTTYGESWTPVYDPNGVLGSAVDELGFNLSGSPGNNAKRIDLATTEDNPNLVVACVTMKSGLRLSKSYNGGTSWSATTATTYTNYKHEDKYYYNDIIISPEDEDIIYHGDQLIQRSTNGGVDFSTLFSYGSGDAHVDLRDFDIIMESGYEQVYCGNDGGLDVYNGNNLTFTKLNGSELNISQIYGFDFNPNKSWIVLGCQDIALYNYTSSNKWENRPFGDTYNMLYNPYTTPESMFGQKNGSGILQSFNQGLNWGYVPEGGESGEGKRPMELDIHGNLYIGSGGLGHDNTKLHRKKHGVNELDIVGNFSNSIHQIQAIGISKNNPNTIYIGYDEPFHNSNPNNRFFKTENALDDENPIDWEDMTNDLPVDFMGISAIEVDPFNCNNVWVATGIGFGLSQVQTKPRVHYSNDGGISFEPLNNNLKINGTTDVEFPVNTMVLDEATGGLYIGTDIGVFYNDTPTDPDSPWECYNREMPIALVTELKIDYCSRKLLASTFGRGLWECNLAEEPTINNRLETTEGADDASALLNVPEGEIRFFYSDITIASGETFSIEGTVKMAPGRTITIEPGAILDIDGGTITSTCDKPWGGINLEGSSFQDQLTSSNQGVLISKNGAVIENALTAVHVYGEFDEGGIDWNTTGGIIKATNTTFKNNKRDVEFLSYKNKPSSNQELWNVSYFMDCSFITNDDNHILQPSAHITMFDVNGVRILGCTFEDERTTYEPLFGRTGIYSIKANYNLRNYCTFQDPNNCTNNRTQFINLSNAVYSLEDGDYGQISIENCDFNCYNGVYLQNIHNAVVRSNEFTVSHEFYFTGNTAYPYGLYLDRSQGFNTEGNSFVGFESLFSIEEGAAVGLVVRNSGSGNNEFYRSDFQNFKVGSQVLSDNRYGDYAGLTFRCNTYQDNYFDIDVREDIYSPSKDLNNQLGMATNQGLSLLPKNEFTTTSVLELNILNEGSNKMQYVVPDMVSNYYPSEINSPDYVNILIDPDGDGDCPNMINSYGDDKPSLESSLSSIRSGLITTQGTWNTQKDGGNTPGLMVDIETATVGNIGSVFGQLIAYSPYLSEEVLATVAEQQTPFTHEMIRDVMLANPQSARSFWVQNTLDSNLSPLPDVYRDLINEQDSVYTSRDTLLNDLVTINYQYDQLLSELLYSYLSDSVYQLSDIHFWLKHPTNPRYHYQLAERYFDNGDHTSFQAVVDSVWDAFDLDPWEQAYHNAFVDLFDQIDYWQQSGVYLFEPDSSRKAWLLNFAATHDSAYPARVYSLLAVNDTFIEKPRVYIPNMAGGVPVITNKIQALATEDDPSMISVYPNPTKDAVTLEWKEKAQNAQVNIYDVGGKIVFKGKWEKEEQIKIKVDQWPVGVYFIKVKPENGEEMVSKLMIQR